jgi:hypothetical protein
VQDRKPVQYGVAARRKFHEHFAAILIPVPAPQRALVNETIYKFHRTVMPKAELPGECGNSRTSAFGQAFERQE